MAMCPWKIGGEPIQLDDADPRLCGRPNNGPNPLHQDCPLPARTHLSYRDCGLVEISGRRWRASRSHAGLHAEAIVD